MGVPVMHHLHTMPRDCQSVESELAASFSDLDFRGRVATLRLDSALQWA